MKVNVMIASLDSCTDGFLEIVGLCRTLTVNPWLFIQNIKRELKI